MVFSQIFRQNSAMTNQRSGTCFVVTKRVLEDNKTLQFFVRTIVNPQDGGRNTVTIKPRLRLKTILRLLEEDPNIRLEQLPVKLHCTCKAFQYWGSAYNLSVIKSKVGTKEHIQPDIRDPERTNFMCKHCAKVFKRYGSARIAELLKIGR